MKKLLLTIILITPMLLSFGAPVIKAVINNGNWSSNSTWDLNRVPQIGDTVSIPTGKTVIISNFETVNGFLYIKIYGVMKMSSGKLDIGNTGVIMVYTGGKISGTGCSCEQIRIGGTKKYKGDPDVLGPQYASSSTSDFDPFIALPVKYISFTLNYTNNNVLVQWSTSDEVNASMFQVERSFDGSDWIALTSISAIGNSADVTNYSYTDKNISARVIYYRIKEIDMDGKFTYTAVRSLKTEIANAGVQILSFQNQVLLQFASEIRGTVMVQFISLSGQVIDKQMLHNPSGQMVLSSKIKGNCIVSLSDDQSFHVARQIIL